MNKVRLITILILLLHVFALIIYHIYGYIGHFGFDDMQYAEIANGLKSGIIDYNDHFTYRFPIIFFTSLSYYFFGVSDFASSLPPLICTISIIFLVFQTLKKASHLTLIIGLSLTTFSNWFIFYSDKLMPDIYVAFSFFFSLYIINAYKFHSDKKKPVLYSVILAFTLLFGFMSKGTIILILPLLIYFVIADLIKKRDVNFWIYSIISCILMLTIYFLIIWALTGDFSSRFKAITSNSYLNLCSYDKQSFNVLFKRISFEFWNLMIFQGMFTGFVFIFAFLFQRKIKAVLQINESLSFYLVSAIILFLSCNFMTISPTSYIPMCLDPRHYLFLTPIVAIPASYIITEYIKEKKYAVQIILCLISVTFLSFFLQGDSFWELYLPLTVLFGFVYLFVKNKKFRWIFIVFFVLIMMVKPYFSMRYAHTINYSKQKEIALEYIINRNEDCYIITDYVQKRLVFYLSGFNKNSKYTLLSFNNFNIDTLANKKKMLFLNWYTQYLSGFDANDLPYYAKNIDSSDVLVYKNSELNVSIFELKNISNQA
ncbi:MAG: glycosyltransferase family 39 protein, partial [Bacteroidota bacterium]